MYALQKNGILKNLKTKSLIVKNKAKLTFNQNEQ